ncbi:hypothetical protein [Rufibacter roseus]|uniref:Uncharacterized protein n=1 Tax=Rufibacter roseus TaxID=1567108 RepID=A0ABW2DP03_9BACT|nr:hypothetical protein [Rufibacter roseus]
MPKKYRKSQGQEHYERQELMSKIFWIVVAVAFGSWLVMEAWEWLIR